jgi:Clp amino terminal domain, pathogenicity island component
VNLEKFTDRAKGFLQSAQTVAIRMNHQRISPDHILKALLEDSEGMAAGLIQRAGGNPQLAVQEVDKALAALLQTWGTAARRHPVGGLGSIGEMLIEHNHGFGQGRGSNSECSFNQAHLPHDTWLQAPCLGLSFA